MRLRVAAVVLLSATGAFAQTGSLTEREINQALESSVWRVGPFRLAPQIRLGAGYDDNALSSALVPQEDVSFLAGPGLRAVVPFGRRGLVDLYEELDFVYFREVAALRDVFNVTRVGGAFGGRSVLFRVNDEFRDEKARPSSEFDVPVDQNTNRLAASLTMALGHRHELTVGVDQVRVRIGDPLAQVRDVLVSNRLDRTQGTLRVEIERHVTARTTLFAEGFHDRIDFTQDVPQGTPLTYGVRGGLSFSPKGNARGQILLGFKDVRPDPGQPTFRGLVAETNVDLRLGTAIGVGGVFTRDIVPSILENNWYFVENRYGGSVTVYFARRASVRPEVQFGRNTYPQPVRVVDDSGQVVMREVADTFRNLVFTFSYRIKPSWAVSATANYLSRDSDVLLFQKDRFFVNFGLNREF